MPGGKGSKKQRGSSYSGAANKCNRDQRSRANSHARAIDNGLIRPPPKPLSIILSYVPVVDGIDMMNRLLRGGIAIAPSVCQHTSSLLLEYMATCIWYQHKGQSNQTASSAGCRRLSNHFHTRNSLLCRSDIKPTHPMILPLVPSTPTNRQMCEELYKDIIAMLVEDLMMHTDDERHVRIRMQRYMEKTWIGRHADSDRKIGDILFMMRLVFGVGPSRHVKFTAGTFDLLNPKSRASFSNLKDVTYTIKTSDCASVYLMTASASGKKPLCYMNEQRTKEVVAHHEVLPNDSKDHVAIAVIDFPLRSLKAVNLAKKRVRTDGISLRRRRK